MKKLSGGIDIGSEKHHVIITDENGKVLYDREVAHKFNEFRQAIREFKMIEDEQQGDVTFAKELYHRK